MKMFSKNSKSKKNKFYNFERPHQSLVGKRLQRFIEVEKFPRRQHERYNEKQTKVHLNS